MRSLKSFFITLLLLIIYQPVFAVDANEWLIGQMNQQLSLKEGALSDYLSAQGRDPSGYEVYDVGYKWNWTASSYNLVSTIANPVLLGTNEDYRCQPYTKSKATADLEIETQKTISVGVETSVSESFENTDVWENTLTLSYGTNTFVSDLTTTLSTSTESMEENNKQSSSSQTARCSLSQKLKPSQTPAYAYLKNTTTAISYTDANTGTDNIGFTYTIKPSTAATTPGTNEATTVKIREKVTVPSIELVLSGTHCPPTMRSKGVSNGKTETIKDVAAKYKNGDWKLRCHTFLVSGNANNSGKLTIKKRGDSKEWYVNFTQSSITTTDKWDKNVWSSPTGTTSGKRYDIRDMIGEKGYISYGEVTNKGRPVYKEEVTLDIYDGGKGIFDNLDSMTYVVEGTQKADSNDMASQCTIVVLTWDNEDDRQNIKSLCQLSDDNLPPDTDASQFEELSQGDLQVLRQDIKDNPENYKAKILPGTIVAQD